MAPPELQFSGKTRRTSWLGTVLIAAVYLAVMIATNSRFTILDDEANSVAIAGRPVAQAVAPFLFNDSYRELHPPETEIVWHAWLAATNHALFLLRVLANFFYFGAALMTALCAEKMAGRRAYWAALLTGLAWPFAFQYGRIAGWYTLSTFLLAVVTWLYLRLIEAPKTGQWAWFALMCVVFIWSNYFGFVFLLLLLADLLIFHRDLAARNKRAIAITAVVIAATFLPLIRAAFADVGGYIGDAATGVSVSHELAAVGYPAFAMLGSAAVAPWFWPLSVPVAIAALLLGIAILRSTGRRWLVYAVLAMLTMDAARVFDIKRVLIFLPWLFLAVVLSLGGETARFPRTARVAVAVMLIAGWIGIASGEHYATTNLHEPWKAVARVVAEDARHGATVVSENQPFFFYLDYALGLEKEMPAADAANLGSDLYARYGYTILEPDQDGKLASSLRGKVVLVNGSGMFEDVQAMKALDDALGRRCSTLGEYRAAPDPAMAWKQRFTRDVPVLPYRTDVTWYDCH